jgi:hypothetical protein
VIAIDRVDGGMSLHEVALAEIFVRGSHFAALVAQRFVDRTCTKPLDERHVAPAITGFWIDDTDVAFRISMNKLGCSPVSEDIAVPWSELEPFLTRTGIRIRDAATSPSGSSR